MSVRVHLSLPNQLWRRLSDEARLAGCAPAGHIPVRNPGTKTSALDVAAALPSKELSLDELSSGKGRSRDFDMDM